MGGRAGVSTGWGTLSRQSAAGGKRERATGGIGVKSLIEPCRNRNIGLVIVSLGGPRSRCADSEFFLIPVPVEIRKISYLGPGEGKGKGKRIFRAPALLFVSDSSVVRSSV